MGSKSKRSANQLRTSRRGVLHPKPANRNANPHDNNASTLSTLEHRGDITQQSATKENDKSNPGVAKNIDARVNRKTTLETSKEEKYSGTSCHTTNQAYFLDVDNTTKHTHIPIPVKTKKTKKQLKMAKQFYKNNHQKDDFEYEKSDMSMNFGDTNDIFQHLLSMEVMLKPDPFYMDKQPEITWEHRSVVIEWIMEVHHVFEFLPETLFLTVNLLDRFLTSKGIREDELQLASITALLLASKYEESDHSNKLTLYDCVEVTQHSYTTKDISNAEKHILRKLEYNLGWPGPMNFLRRISKADDYDVETRNMAKYFLEVATLDRQFVDCVPSFLSAGAYYLARCILNMGGWSRLHIYYSGYTVNQLRDLAKAIRESCYQLGNNEKEAFVMKKYASKKFKYVSVKVKNGLEKR